MSEGPYAPHTGKPEDDQIATAEYALGQSNLAMGPFRTVCSWLLSEQDPAPPYVLTLVKRLQRFSNGTATQDDTTRLQAWLPSGINQAHLVRNRDKHLGQALLRELGALAEALPEVGQ